MLNRKVNGMSGYLTVYLSLILTIMISLCLTLILGVRENTRRMQIECVTDIGMNNILAEYHRELFNQYQLLFIDTSYGTNEANYMNTAQNLRKYIQMNLGGEDILFSSIFYRDLLKLELKEVSILAVSVATDEEGAVLRRQAVEVMKQKVGLVYIDQIQNWYQLVQEYKLTQKDVYKEQKKVKAELESWNGSIVMDNGIDKKVKIETPGDHISSLWETGVLGLVVDDVSSLSEQMVNLALYVSERPLITGTGIPEYIIFEDNWMDQLFFHEYVLRFTGRYDKQKENSLLKYQTEYILAGENSDQSNLKSVIYKLLGIRAAANLLYLTSDNKKMELTEMAANILATIVMLPQVAPVLQTMLVLTWSMAESLYDVSQLLQGNKVPLMKTNQNWHYNLEEIYHFGNLFIGKKQESGLSYSDYLRILLCFQKKETTTFRLMDIMEMDIRSTKGNAFFRMDGCIDSIKAIIEYAGKDKKTYTIERCYGY